ncbi:PP2C family protein-serine/threonine phosphatase [Kolteria novifilia]|uniref:PP2C family protein-serine/threonine phosphatase n=1 Tax=Kolteria novifilia TaxID=2527975 RepID=UPI003AF377D6
MDEPSGNHRSAASPFRILAGKCTDIGNFRDNNEDRYYIDEERAIYIVADGMGGQAAGEQASQIAVDIIPEKLAKLPVECQDEEEVKGAVSQAVIAANEAIIAQGNADPSVQNMGTTVVIATMRGEKVYLAHVGDSRAYFFRDGSVASVTTDHNLAQALFDAKTITQEELKNHRFKHVLWKYLGSKEADEGPDMERDNLQAGDRILLATDGICGVVDDEVIVETINRHDDPQACAEELVRLALESGSKDNITVVVLFIEAAADPSQTASSTNVG